MMSVQEREFKVGDKIRVVSTYRSDLSTSRSELTGRYGTIKEIEFGGHYSYLCEFKGWGKGHTESDKYSTRDYWWLCKGDIESVQQSKEDKWKCSHCGEYHKGFPYKCPEKTRKKEQSHKRRLERWKKNRTEENKMETKCCKTEKIEKPKTQLEKQALDNAKKDRIEVELERKAEAYKAKMSSYILVEREARSMRKEADRLKDLLCITEKEQKQLFED